MTNPLLSIVIANRNYGRFLEEAIQSVIKQNVGDKVELIICDAASTDNSVEIIKKYANGLPPNTMRSEWVEHNSQLSTHNSQLITWWCSETDGGQSAAFNKGFAHARGEWITWLNADEMYLPGALSAFLLKVKNRPNAEWITANDLKFDDATMKIANVGWGPHWQPWILKGVHAPAAVFGPSSFVRKSTYNRIGEFDRELHYSMDYDYWIRLTMNNVRQVRLNKICWADRIQPCSKTFGVSDSNADTRKSSELRLVENRHGYLYRFSFRNIWYCIWILSRFLDLSLFVRWFSKMAYEGTPVSRLLGKK